MPSKCSIIGCNKKHTAKGLCNTHYGRFLRTGTAYRPSVEERFWMRVDKSMDCWIWTGGKTKSGYGCFRFNGKQDGAHRYSYHLHFGSISDGKEVCHKCDNPSCVRPSHLFLGTHADNMNDCVEKGRNFKLKTKPGEQHPGAILSEDNVRSIRYLRERGKSTKYLSEKFQVSIYTIYAITSRRTWQHIQEALCQQQQKC